MKIKNKTNSTKQLRDLLSGKLVLVEGNKTIELERASFNSNAFEVVEDKIEKKEKLKTEKEVN
jgi:hypothetical protein